MGPYQASGSGTSLPEIQHPLIYRPSSLTTLGTPPYTPMEIRKAYNFNPLYGRGIQGNGTRIAIIDAFGSSSLLTDLATFDSLTGLPTPTVNFYYPDGVPKQKNTGWAVETSLDVEWAHAIAPAATIDLVVALDATGASIFDAISFVAKSLPGETALSMSFGLSESLYPTTGSFTIAAIHQLFVNITSHGTTPLASSGDSGATTCCNIQYPSSDPLVVAVGGTSLILNSDASYAVETAWSGSTAGASLVFPKPTYQQGLGDSVRDTTDVSYDADPNTGVLVIFGNRLFQVGGTSAGAPQWAALVALASQANSAAYGAANNRLYKIASYHDVTAGSDGFFTATTGWDYPTGLGSPDANATVRSLSTTMIPIAINSVTTFQGVSVSTTGTLAISSATLNFSGTTTVTAKNSTTGALLFTKSYAIPSIKLLSRGSNFQGSFLVNIAVSPYPLSSDVTITFSGTAATVSVQVTRQVDIDGNGVVNIIDIGILTASYGATLGSPNYNPRADLDANGTINIIDVSIGGAYFGAPDFI